MGYMPETLMEIRNIIGRLEPGKTYGAFDIARMSGLSHSTVLDMMGDGGFRKGRRRYFEGSYMTDEFTRVLYENGFCF